MASVKTISAVAVVIILVAAAAAVALTYDDGNDDNTGSAIGLKAELAKGDYYTILQYEETATTGAEPSGTETTTTITDIAGDGTLTVEVSTSVDGADPTTITETMYADAFVAPIYCYIEDTTGLATAALDADGGAVQCWIYVNEVTSGSWTFKTTDYVSKDGYVVYRTIAEATYNGETSTLVKDLRATSMVVEGGTGLDAGSSGSSSGTSSGSSSGVRTSLVVGDYITYQETDERNRVSTETIEVVSIDGNYVTVRETDSDGDTDVERKTASWFVGQLLFGSTTWVTYSTTQTITLTVNDESVAVECYVYIDEDSDDRDTYWVGVSDGVLYKAEYYDKEDGETESEVLVGTSLFSDASGSSESSSGTSSGTSPGSSNAVRTSLVVGDYILYMIQCHNTDGETLRLATEMITVDDISGDSVYVSEVESDGVPEHEWETASWFIEQLLYDVNQATYSATETIQLTVNSVSVSAECHVYIDEDSDGRDTYWVGVSDGVLYKVEHYDIEHGTTERKTLSETSLFSDASGSSDSSSGTSSGTASTNSYGVTLAVGDTYTIRETDEDGSVSTETYTIVSIDGSRLTVMETEGSRASYDVTTADDFLDDILVTQSRLSFATHASETVTVNGVSCDVYTFTDVDEVTVYYVDSGTGLVIKIEEFEGRSVETAELTAYSLSFI